MVKVISPRAAKLGMITTFREYLSERNPRTGCVPMPTTCDPEMNTAVRNDENSRSIRRYTGRKVIVTPWAALNPAVTISTVSNALRAQHHQQ